MLVAIVLNGIRASGGLPVSLMESVLVEDSLSCLDSAGHRVQTWDNGYDSRMLWTFWIFKQQPYFALEVVGRKRFLFFFDKTFAFPENKQTQFLLKPLYRVSRQSFFFDLTTLTGHPVFDKTFTPPNLKIKSFLMGSMYISSIRLLMVIWFTHSVETQTLRK